MISPEQRLEALGVKDIHLPPKANGHDKARAPTGETTCITAQDLQRQTFQAVRYAVPKTIPEGVSLLCGKPKLGKSWLMLGACASVAYGGPGFNGELCEQGDVLYVALEDNRRRLQRRLQQLLGDRPWPPRLTIETRMPRLDEGGIEYLEHFIKRSEHPRLICVDTLGRARPRTTGKNGMYADDYDAMSSAQELAGDHGLAIVFVHHLRKAAADDPFDEVSGTLGLNGGADTVMVLKHEAGRADAVLYGRGRDVDDFELAMNFDKRTGLWSLLGDAQEFRHSQDKAAIIEVLRLAGVPLGPKAVADDLDKPLDTIKQAMRRMEREGLIGKRERGQYVAL